MQGLRAALSETCLEAAAAAYLGGRNAARAGRATFPCVKLLASFGRLSIGI